MSICHHFPSINESKIGNALRDVIRAKCSFKHRKGADPASRINLSICLKCYKVGCGQESNPKCIISHSSEKKSKGKHSVILLPILETVWCLTCEADLQDQLSEAQGAGCKDKKMKSLVKMLDTVREKVFLWKDRDKKATNPEIENIINPHRETVHLDNNKHKTDTKASKTRGRAKEGQIIIPDWTFGIKNLGNTCFFNSVMQCLNASTTFKNYYLKNLTYFSENHEHLKSIFKK